jgi:hypothetical protein
MALMHRHCHALLVGLASQVQVATSLVLLDKTDSLERTD